jgi:hypothetical protein
MLPTWPLDVAFLAALKPVPRWLLAAHQDVIAPGETAHGPMMKIGYPYTVFFVVSKGIKVTIPIRGYLLPWGRTARRWDSLRPTIQKRRGNRNCIVAGRFLVLAL